MRHTLSRRSPGQPGPEQGGLRDADLRAANLWGANLYGANLCEVAGRSEREIHAVAKVNERTYF
ncbi:pentapeptide repeat-containing protein [Actinomadura opuntiae]|uniref:pentapeptide repeat-containing protein n=1 Tax=Actinomadura sp. OS1-43 TaxID=604315 RepID=UPI0033429BC1